MSARQPPMALRLARVEPGRVCEFVSFNAERGSGAARDWSASPGHVEPGPDGVPKRLHFAPGRWLLPRVDAALQAQLAAAVQAGAGVCIDADGKWDEWVLEGADAGRALASCIDVDAVLAGRGCAAVLLFDCPAVVMRSGGVYRIWVGASYAPAFADSIRRLAAG